MPLKLYPAGLYRFIFVFLAILTVVLATPWYRFYFASHIIETKIVALDTVEDCNPGFGPLLQYDGRGYGVFDGKRSSLAPALLGRCGGIQTNSGQYHLVGSYQFYGPNVGRKKLLESLEIGCSYALRIIGPGSRQDQKKPAELILRQSIWAVEKLISCE